MINGGFWPARTRVAASLSVESPHSTRCAGRPLWPPSAQYAVRGPPFVAAQQPQVSGNRDGSVWDFRDIVLALGWAVLIGEQVGKLVIGEAYQVEVESVLLQRLQLDAQHLFIPACGQGQPIVGQHQGAALRRCQVVEDDHRD